MNLLPHRFIYFTGVHALSKVFHDTWTHKHVEYINLWSSTSSIQFQFTNWVYSNTTKTRQFWFFILQHCMLKWIFRDRKSNWCKPLFRKVNSISVVSNDVLSTSYQHNDFTFSTIEWINSCLTGAFVTFMSWVTYRIQTLLNLLELATVFK